MVSEQISGWLRRTKPRQKTLQISPETIYKTLYFRSREALHHLNIQHLRRSIAFAMAGVIPQRRRGTINIVNGTPIHERSRNIDNRRSLGHWEGDLVSGTKNSHIATLVDRKSRYTIILDSGQRFCLSKSGSYRQIPEFTVRTQKITDMGQNGTGRASRFTVSTGVKVYFCDPQSPWQREQMRTQMANSAVLSKKTCLAQYTQHELDLVAAQLNNRPRKDTGSKHRKNGERGCCIDRLNLQLLF